MRAVNGPGGKMIILWIRKNKSGNKDFTDAETFQEHDDVMKRFRMAHPDLNLSASNDIVTDEGNLLAPVHQVKLAANIQN
jgi:hypothetical protein